MNDSPSIVWFRQDLRLADNPALAAAIRRGSPVVPVYVHDSRDTKWSHGRASRWWLRRSLSRLDSQLLAAGSRLLLRTGDPARVLVQLANGLGSKHVYFNRRYDPQGIREQSAAERALKRAGIPTESFNASLLFEPEVVRNRKGEPFRVFTAFWNACLELPAPAAALPLPARIVSPKAWPKGVEIEDLELESGGDDDAAWAAHWAPGAEAAAQVLKSFASRLVQDYGTARDCFGVEGTSRLSPYLHSGEISARQVWHRIEASSGRSRDADATGATAFLRQLGWREFAHYLLYHYPQTADKPLRSEYARFPWRNNKRLLEEWRHGQTGYPVVDAGMRELSQTGWMHNRVRMVASSFLVKHLLIPWQSGARWFWERLVDADLANNTLGWQWVAGCGADAAPFFRIFNPVSQGMKFDPKGQYVRKWVPELSRLPNAWIHRPWQAPGEALAEAGVSLGRTYPSPIVDHAMARHRALGAYDEMRAGK